MKLNYIETDRCLICGCNTVVSEHVETEFNTTKIREHSSGGRWEYRQFACGCEIHYCPNFRKEKIKKECSLDPKKIEREKKRGEAKDMLYVTIEKLDVDQEYKTRLKGTIKYV